jgi:hypothetical protein
LRPSLFFVSFRLTAGHGSKTGFALRFQGQCLLQQHHRNVIFDGIDEFAVPADQLLLFFKVFEVAGTAGFPYAFGTSQYFQ